MSLPSAHAYLYEEPPVEVMVDTTIRLNEQELKLCDLLLEVCQHAQKQQPNLTLRIAGGWVRDKLLRHESHDVDIAIDGMMGYDFARCVQTYVLDVLKKPQILGHHGNVTRIKSNPDKSKHLETATVRLFEMEIDFVNLRNEVYEAGSRIPRITFGTPEEDASRRDLTINSLFYNIHTRRVEDFLGKGLDDLRQGIIRTPLAPFETFRDDPLRILRATRFAARFGYTVDPTIQEAIQSDGILEALCSVISKERIGDEIRKMIDGPRPVRGVQLLHQFSIFKHLLHLEHQPIECQRDGAEAVAMVRNVTVLLAQPDLLHSLVGVRVLPRDERRHALLACLLFPFVGMINQQHPQEAYTLSLAKQALKMSIHESLQAHTLLQSAHRLRSLFKELQASQLLTKWTSDELVLDASHELEWKRWRLRLGKYVRDVGKVMHQWYPLVFLVEMAESAMQQQPAQVPRSLVEERMRLFQLMQRMQILKAYELRPLLNGNQLRQVVSDFSGQPISAGKWLGELMDRVVEWQLAEDGIEHQCTEEKCKEFVLELLQRNEIQFQLEKRPRVK